MDIFRLSHYVHQIFLLFLKGESTGLSGDPGDDDDALLWRSFQLLCDLKLDPVAGSIRDTDAVQEGSVYCDDSAPEDGRRLLQRFRSGSRCHAGAGVRRLYRYKVAHDKPYQR